MRKIGLKNHIFNQPKLLGRHFLTQIVESCMRDLAMRTWVQRVLFEGGESCSIDLAVRIHG